MQKLEIIIRPEKLEDVKDVLDKSGVYGMTVSMVSGCGHQKGRKEIYRGTEYNINLIPKVRIESVVKDELVDGLLLKIIKAVETGEVGDGKIFIYKVENAVRIRTGEYGECAI